jgi:Branched-chain amino acid ABC-type transport system, permease components
VRAVVIGLLTALLAVGMALVYRANRVLNFSQADLGFVPATLSVGLIVFNGLPYLFGFGVGLAAALVLGAIVELAIVRRFVRSPRLVLTVATLGITQLLTVLALLVPRMWGEVAASQRINPPIDWKLTIGTFILNANDLIAIIVAPLAMIAIGLFLSKTTLGTAVRAAAERSDRAALLGIPVGWLVDRCLDVGVSVVIPCVVLARRNFGCAYRWGIVDFEFGFGARGTGHWSLTQSSNHRCCRSGARNFGIRHSVEC